MIAVAAHNLPKRQRGRAIFWGGVSAIVMQIAFALVVTEILVVPGLRFVGAVLLLAIGCKLLQENNEEGSEETQDDGSATSASIVRIALVNLVMSFDNVVAVASVSRGDPVRIVIGLVISGSVLLVSTRNDPGIVGASSVANLCRGIARGSHLGRNDVARIRSRLRRPCGKSRRLGAAWAGQSHRSCALYRGGGRLLSELSALAVGLLVSALASVRGRAVAVCRDAPVPTPPRRERSTD